MSTNKIDMSLLKNFLKVSKVQNKFMKSSFLTNSEDKNCQDFSPHYIRQQFWQFFVCILGEKMTAV